jgi:hypothetical protein
MGGVWEQERALKVAARKLEWQGLRLVRASWLLGVSVRELHEIEAGERFHHQTPMTGSRSSSAACRSLRASVTASWQRP